MKILHRTAWKAAAARRGAALMMAMLVLFVLVVIVFQISISTTTDGRIARNQTTLANMDSAIESVLLRIFEDLAADGEADAASGQAGGGLGSGGGLPGQDGGAAAAGPTDSSRDQWARPGRFEINDLSLRILFQDEDSKYNVLGMLAEDAAEAEKARTRVAKILDLCREGTTADIDLGDAELMADAMLDHMRERSASVLPKPYLLSDPPDIDSDVGLPLTLREFVVLEPFDESDFRDYRDENGTIVHSIGSFLTTWTSLTTGQEAANAALAGQQANDPAAPATSDPEMVTESGAGGDGDGGDVGPLGQEQSPEVDPAGLPGTSGPRGTGGAGGAGGPLLNLNRAPAAVLHALMDDRDVSPYFWDAVLEYRNEEDEEAQADQDEPVFDEFSEEELVVRQIFSSVDGLRQIDGWESMEPIVQAEVQQLLDVQSHVFSIFVTARRRTGEEGDVDFRWDSDVVEEEEEMGMHLVRTVRCIVWRRQSGNDMEIVPLEHWEVLDYVPYEILDFPDEER